MIRKYFYVKKVRDKIDLLLVILYIWYNIWTHYGMYNLHIYLASSSHANYNPVHIED